MIKRLRGLGRDEGGQVLALLIATIFVLVIFMITIPSVTYVLAHKTQTQTAADAGALAGATWVARSMNMVHSANLGIAGCYTAIGVDVLLWGVSAALLAIPGGQPVSAAISLALFDTENPILGIENLGKDVNRLYEDAKGLCDVQDQICANAIVFAQQKAGEVFDANLTPRWGEDAKYGCVVYPEPDVKLTLEVLPGVEEHLVGPVKEVLGFLEGVLGFIGWMTDGYIKVDFDRQDLSFGVKYKIPRYYYIVHYYTWIEERPLPRGGVVRIVHHVRRDSRSTPGRRDLWDEDQTLKAAEDYQKYVEDGEFLPGVPSDWEFDYSKNPYKKDTLEWDKQTKPLVGPLTAALPRTLSDECIVHCVGFAYHPPTKVSGFVKLFRGAADVEIDQFAFAHAELVPPDRPQNVLTPFKVGFRAKLVKFEGPEVERAQTLLDDNDIGVDFQLDKLLENGLLNH